ncbi:condensation domain-containing protein [Lentzea sp. NPDC059081]|uniref:condensation domain-containing protein n=1 Tax=Lentzea sp. NPDC059081 TaxID=3346719 RepID=UPI003687378B
MSMDLKGAYVFPPSRNQAQLWLQEQTQELGSSYHITANLRLRGRVRPGALATAVSRLVARHEALRTVFRELDGALRQIVLPHLEVRLERPADLAGLDALAESPFDLERGPLVRAALVRLAVDDHVFGLVVHHLVADGWSVDLVLRELIGLYDALVSGKDGELPPPSLQYADFTLWEQETLTADVVEEEIGFWRRELADAAPVLELPLDRNRSAERDAVAAGLEISVPGEVVLALEELAGRCGATLNMVVMAAFQVLLARYSGQERFAVGTAGAGRTGTEFEDVVGFFATLLPSPVDVSGQPTFTELVGRVRRHVLDALAHQRLPFDQLVSALRPQRIEGASPLFQVTFQLLHDNGGGVREAAGVSFEPIASTTGHLMYELSFTALRGEGLRCAFHWSKALFDEATVHRMAQNFLVLLESAVHRPEEVVWCLPILTRAERDQLERWSGERRGSSSAD